MSMTTTFKRSSGKSSPITISAGIQLEIRKYKQRLIEMAEFDELRDVDKQTIKIILEGLEPYDQYLLLAFYALQLKPADLAKTLGTTSQIITTRINKIQNYVRDRVIDATGDSSILN